MSKTKLTIISIFIVTFVLCIFNFKNIYYLIYKEKAKNLVIEKMKSKYNIDINIKKVWVGGYKFSYNPVCKVEFNYNNNKYYALVDTLNGLDNIYDNYQYKDIKKVISDYINDKIGVKYSNMELQYNGNMSFLIPHNLKKINSESLTNIYFNGNNYNEILKDGNIDLTYDIDVIDEEKIKEIFKVFPKTFRYNITYNNKEANKENYVAKDITCTYKRFSYDEDINKEEQYRLDFGKIKSYGKYEVLKNASIIKTEPFDLKLINDYNSNKYKIVSDFYKTSCNTIEYEMISFYFPITKKRNKSYSLGIKEVDKDGKVDYFISDAYFEKDENTILINTECWDSYEEYVILENYN